jgi:hypothetical protein
MGVKCPIRIGLAEADPCDVITVGGILKDERAPLSCLELKLQGELDGTGAADLVEGAEAAIGAAGA